MSKIKVKRQLNTSKQQKYGPTGGSLPKTPWLDYREPTGREGREEIKEDGMGSQHSQTDQGEIYPQSVERENLKSVHD